MGFASHIANVELPALGAFYPDAETVDIEVNEAAREKTPITILAKYELGEGSTTGRCRFRIVWIVGLPDGSTREVLDTLENSTISASTSTGIATVQCFQRVRDLYACKDGEWCSFEVFLRRNAVGFRIEPAEAGDTENPGTVWFDIEGLP